MYNLLAWIPQYSDDDPIIVAAWLHHRFMQIHPYQDGNGRLARAIATMILLQADLPPIVVDRDLRTEYIEALELADRADLSRLAEMFAGLERRAIVQALSLDTDTGISYQKGVTSATIANFVSKIGKAAGAEAEGTRARQYDCSRSESACQGRA